MEITPAQLHMHLDVLFSSGILPNKMVGAPVVHGEEVAGIHGIGVKTPIAADVAEATVGLAKDVHMPNGMILTIGL